LESGREEIPGIIFVRSGKDTLCGKIHDCGFPRRRMHGREILVGESMAAEAPRRGAESLLLA